MTAVNVASPSWYDVLDVDPTASAADIRDAWKRAIADLEPSDRRFRLSNQAAEVLLDHRSRATYDAELFASELDAEHADTAVVESAPERSHRQTSGETSGEPVATVTRESGRVVPGWMLVTVAAVAALVVGACSVLAATAPSDASIADATRAAQAAAERAIVPILSYDGSRSGDLEADQRAAEGFMTDDYRDDYAKLFEVVKANAPRTGTKVTVGSSRVDLQACKLEYSIVSPK